MRGLGIKLSQPPGHPAWDKNDRSTATSRLPSSASRWCPAGSPNQEENRLALRFFHRFYSAVVTADTMHRSSWPGTKSKTPANRPRVLVSGPSTLINCREMSSPGDERLLAELEDLIRAMPSRDTIQFSMRENNAWLGRVCAVIDNWDKSKDPLLQESIEKIFSRLPNVSMSGYRRMSMLLHQARHDLLIQMPASGTVAVQSGMVLTTLTEFARSSNLPSRTFSLSIRT